MSYRHALTIVLVTLCLSAKAKQPAMPQPAATEDGIAVYFSPKGGCLDALVTVINSATKTLDVQAYLLTTTEIARPIKAAHDRGVKVRVVMDAKNAGIRYSSATYFVNAGIPVWTDAEHGDAHNKVMIVDGETVITGSFNFTKSADEDNAENLLVITGKPKLAKAYEDNFEKHLKHSKPYEGAKAEKE